MSRNPLGRAVTERDFRMEEFKDANPDDYEFRRGDGKIVRKDRWEIGIRNIAVAIGYGGKEWEIDDIVEEARLLKRLHTLKLNPEAEP